MKKKQNIVLITIDSLRADFVGYHNQNEKNTPFLDSFADKSYSFTNAISPANPTFFTFCSIMTGTLPFAFGNYLGIPNNNKIKTLAEVLKKHGYTTYAFLADSPALYSIYGYDKGFDYYDDGYNPSSRHSIPGKKLNEKVERDFYREEKEPFFLWLHYMDTHLPFFSGLEEYFFKDKKPSERALKKKIFQKELIPSVKEMKIKDKKSTEIFREAYRSCVKYMDKAVDEMVSFLQGKYPDTIFIIVSDHGEALMEHGMFGHEPYSLYNELIHIPILIHIPSLKPRKIAKTVSLVSLAKTISELVGIKEPQFQGNNLLKDAVFSPINNISRILYKCRSPHVRLGILDNKTEIRGYTELWSFTKPDEKYILEKNGKIEEYYLLLEDPDETINLMKNKRNKKNKTTTNRAIIAELKKIMESIDKKYRQSLTKTN